MQQNIKCKIYILQNIIDYSNIMERDRTAENIEDIFEESLCDTDEEDYDAEVREYQNKISKELQKKSPSDIRRSIRRAEKLKFAKKRLLTR